MLKHAEAVFGDCADLLLEGPRRSQYLEEEADLSTDARRLAVLLLVNDCFPDAAPPVPAGWEAMAGLLDAAGAARAHLPPLKGEDPVDAHTLSETGFFYERLKDFQAVVKNGKVTVRSSQLKRKRSGTYFTPFKVCDFMVRRALNPLIERVADDPSELLNTRLLDPAMGTGQFLLAASELFVECLKPSDAEAEYSLRRRFFDDGLFGVELDRENVDVARILLGLYTNRSEPELKNILQGDALIDSDKDNPVFGGEGFPDRFFTERNEPFDGFDAIVGNPPYLSAKTEVFSKYKPYLSGATQADFYLLFIQKYAARKYLRPGGGLCFIVPDPLLLRANAQSARERLLDGLDLEMLLHIKGVFHKTSVANVIFLARPQVEEKRETVEVARLEKPFRVRSFRKRGEDYLRKVSREIPVEYFRASPRKEFCYLLDERSMSVLKYLDTQRPAVKGSGIVIRTLKSLASTKGSIFRGEEIGKHKVKDLAGEKGLPMLLGGESLSKYAVRNDGLFIPEEKVKKDVERYRRGKILLQKSTGKIVAALDETGCVVPQSVYGILIDDHRIGYPFLLTQLNSRLLTYFMHVMCTGYKLLQPQIEIEDIRRIPVMVPVFEETQEVRSNSLDTAKELFSQYLRTDDPGWILEYVDDSVKLGSRFGSAMLHDLLDFLGNQMIRACSGSDEDALPRERLEWIIDLAIYRIFGLGLEEIETVESFFAEETEEQEGVQVGAEEPGLAMGAE